jgi:hypothetical protein
VEDPRKKENEIVFREVEMECYEIESTPIKLKLNDRPPSICNVWDPMDSFDGLFLVEDLDKTNNGLPSSELKSELDVSVENLLSTQPSSNESIRYQNKSDVDRLFN